MKTLIGAVVAACLLVTSVAATADEYEKVTADQLLLSLIQSDYLVGRKFDVVGKVVIYTDPKSEPYIFEPLNRLSSARRGRLRPTGCGAMKIFRSLGNARCKVQECRPVVRPGGTSRVITWRKKFKDSVVWQS